MFDKGNALSCKSWSPWAAAGFLGLSLLSGCGTVPPAPPELSCPPDLAPGIRVMTVNAFLTVWPAPDYESGFDMTPKKRAEMIADRVLAEKPDVVIFNEVNDDGARSSLIERMTTFYRSYIYELDEHDTDNDSGLMLFSRYRFTVLDQYYPPPDDDFYEAFNGVEPYHVNWRVYPSSMTNGSDAWANKGVALVRILNECDNRSPFSVAFTHTQSTGSPNDDDCTQGEDMQDRAQQMAHIRGLIEQSLSKEHLLEEPVFVGGDLNVDGNQVGANIVSNRDDPVYWSSDNNLDCPPEGPMPFNEWQMTFNSRDSSAPIIDRDLSKGFFSCRGNQPVTQPCSYDGSGGLLGESGTFMIDSWAFESSAQDPGQTHSGAAEGVQTTFTGPHDGVRLDYILHNSPVDRLGNARLCMQHIRRGYATDGPTLSDHLPVSADFNQPAPRCSMRPRMAGDPELLPGDDANLRGPQRVFFEIDDPTSPDFKELTYGPFDGLTGIIFPGSVQWYVIDQAYPYKIATEPTGSPAVTVAYEVYQARDMSTPIGAYQGECVVEDRARECLYLLSDPPYYIKVFAAIDANPRQPDRNSTGSYTITFNRYDCSSIEEACPLETGVLNGPYAWPENQQLDPSATSDTMWFRFETVYPRSGPEGPVLSVLHEYPQQKEDPGGPIDFFTVAYHRKDGQTLAAPHEFVPEPPEWAVEPPGPDPVTPLWRRQAIVPPDALPGLTEGRGVPETYLLSVTRDSNYIDRTTFTWAELKRGLTWFRPLNLTCIVERTYVGQDDIASEFSFGTFNDGKRMLGDVAGDFETWDRGSNMEAHGTPGVVRSNWPVELDAVLGEGEPVKALLWEDLLDNDDFLMSQWGVDGIQELPPDAGPESGSIDRGLLWSNDLDVEDADYRYRMYYRLSHRPLPPKAVGHCGPQREFDDKGTGEFWCFCLNNQACDRDQNGDLTGQVCDLTSGRCVYP